MLCLGTGAVVSGLLYYKNKKFDFSPWKQWMLAGLRFVTVSVICFLLLAPLIQLRITNKQNPVILIFSDNSQSITTIDEQAGQAFQEQIAGLTEELSENYDVVVYRYGDQVSIADSLNFQDKTTDISQVFNTIDEFYSNRNIGAVILAGDGIYNRGLNPLFTNQNEIYPIYTIPLGDTIPRKDLLINRLQHNRITYLNNYFPVEITLEARQSNGTSSLVKIIHEQETIWQQSVLIESDNFFVTIPVELQALSVGLKRYRVEVEPINNEISTDNNVREFFIEVIDSRQKVLIMAASPHPDIGAIKMALEENENFEVEVSLINDFNNNLNDYDVVIWHQLPSAYQDTEQLFLEARTINIPQLFVLGPLTNISSFNQLQTGIELNIRAAGFNDSRAELNNNFSLFRTGDEAVDLLHQFPPLQTHFATYNLAPGTQVMAYQKIGSVLTDYPLVAFTQSSENKTGFIAGEGIWRWRLNNFLRNNNHDAFNEMISSMVQFLTILDDKSFFRVTTENFLFENQPAIFEAELYNKSYELVNSPEVNMIITNEEGDEFEYMFGKTNLAYRLNAGIFPVGEYRYSAFTTLGPDNYQVEGMFTVSSLNLEAINTVANHQLLFQLANNSGGLMVYPDQLNAITNDVNSRQDIRPVLYTQYQYEDIINLRWLFFVVLTFLSIEWFVRKFSGSY
jgi:hypothetical protein